MKRAIIFILLFSAAGFAFNMPILTLNNEVESRYENLPSSMKNYAIKIAEGNKMSFSL